MPLVELTPGFIAQLRDNLADDRGRRTSGFVLAMLSNVCEHAREREWMRDNGVRGVRKLRRPKDELKRNRPWALEERRAVLSTAKPHERVPLALAMSLAFDWETWRDSPQWHPEWRSEAPDGQDRPGHHCARPPGLGCHSGRATPRCDDAGSGQPRDALEHKRHPDDDPSTDD